MRSLQYDYFSEDLYHRHRSPRTPVRQRSAGKYLLDLLTGVFDGFVRRRAAILAFMASLPPEELREFVYVMIRGLIAPLCRRYALTEKSVPAVTDVQSHEGTPALHKVVTPLITAERAIALVEQMSPSDIKVVLPSRQIGLLNLLGDVIKQLGHR